MNALIIQLGSKSEILRTFPAIEALKASGYEKITMMILEDASLKEIASLSPFIDEVITITNNDLTKLESIINNQVFDVVYNLTFSDFASKLTSLIPSKQKVGLTVGQDGLKICQNNWSRYYISQVLQKNLNILHHIDIINRICDIKKYIWPITLKLNEYDKNKIPDKNNKKRFLIHLNSYDSNKAPAFNVWKQTIESILVYQNHEVILVGNNQGDSYIASEIIKSLNTNSKNIYNLCESLSESELVYAIKTSDVVITPESEVVELASFTQTRTVFLPLGGIKPEEVGPYGDGHSILYPALDDPNLYAQSIAETALNPNSNNNKILVPHCITKLESCVDQTKRNVLIAQNFVREETTNLFMQSYYLLAEFRNSGKIEDIDVPKIGDPNQKGSLDKLSNAHETLSATHKASNFGSRFCFEMLKHINDAKKLKDTQKKLDEVDELLESLAKSNYLVKPLIDSFFINKSYVHAESLEDLIGLTEGCYRELSENVEIVMQLIQKAVETAHEQLKKTNHKTNNTRSVELCNRK
jgi:ADP-heptose:LPS heptosyltransferase